MATSGLPSCSYSHAGEAPSLRVCHLRHAYGLGDHYNSVAPLDKLGIPVQED